MLELARKYQLPVETDGPQQERLRQQLSRREKLPGVGLGLGLVSHPAAHCGGPGALQYLRESRGLSEATLDAFELGYAPDQWMAC